MLIDILKEGIDDLTKKINKIVNMTNFSKAYVHLSEKQKHQVYDELQSWDWCQLIGDDDNIYEFYFWNGDKNDPTVEENVSIYFKKPKKK